MSELTQCNYCSLQFITERARKKGKPVLLVKDLTGGITVRVDNKEVTWFMELSKSCCC